MFECEECGKDFDEPIYIEDEPICIFCKSADIIDYEVEE